MPAALNGYRTSIAKDDVQGERYIILEQSGQGQRDKIMVRLEWLKAQLAKIEKEG